MIQLRKLYLSLIVSAAFLSVSNSAISDSPPKHNKPMENDESHSLSAPSSDSPHDKTDRRDVKEGNLSSPPPSDPSTNNAPFDGNEKNRSSSSGHPKPH